MPLLPSSILMLALAVAQQQGDSTPVRVASARDGARVDSARLAREARRAQGAFESVRRGGLPTERDGGVPTCDARVGRLCYWIDDAEPPTPPPEPPRTREARVALVARLDAIARAIPGDGWIAGQLVRYLAEADRTDDAVAAAARCSGDGAWCAALAGYALHVGGRYAAADSAFARALDRMSEAERCRWLDVGELLEDDLASRYARLDCAARARLGERLWRASTPLFALGANDLRTEILSRQVRVRLEAEARSARAMSWGDDLRELTMRYGWPTWYARALPPPGSMMDATITGHDPGPGFTFFPAAAAVDSPAVAGASAWTTDRRPGRMRYSPRWARAMRPMAHQIAVFPRGGSALVVAAYDVSSDTAFGDRPLAGGFFVADAERVHGEPRAGLGRAGTITTIVPATSGIASLELLDTTHHVAARARLGLDVAARVRSGSSDLLLYDASTGAARALDDALARTLRGDAVARSIALGLYWELAPTVVRTPVTVSLAVEPVERGGLVRRIGESLHLTRERGAVRMTWSDEIPASTAPTPRSLALQLGRLRAGRYVIRLTTTPVGGAPRTATREVTVAR